MRLIKFSRVTDPQEVEQCRVTLESVEGGFQFRQRASLIEMRLPKIDRKRNLLEIADR